MEVSRAIDLIDDKMCWGRGTFSAHHMPEHDEYWQAGEMAIEALKKQEQTNTQSVNSTHTPYPNALESLKILESAKDENGCVPMSLVRLAFRNVVANDRWIPVTERLPKEDDYKPCYGYDDGAVWWLNDIGMMGLGWYYTSTENWAFYDEITHVEGIVGNVIAWRPLPESFQKEEE